MSAPRRDNALALIGGNRARQLWKLRNLRHATSGDLQRLRALVPAPGGAHAVSALERALDGAILRLVACGLAEQVGVDETGEPLYQLTPLGADREAAEQVLARAEGRLQ